MKTDERLIITMIGLIGLAFGLIAIFFVVPTLPKPNVTNITSIIVAVR